MPEKREWIKSQPIQRRGIEHEYALLMGNICANPACGRGENLQSHHIVPLQYGGKDDISNLIRLCTTCQHKLHVHSKWYNIKDTLIKWKIEQEKKLIGTSTIEPPYQSTVEPNYQKTQVTLEQIANIRNRKEYYLNQVKNADTPKKQGHQDIRIDTDCKFIEWEKFWDRKKHRNNNEEESNMVKAIGRTEFEKYSKKYEPLSRTNAILAKCYECNGGYVDGKFDCEVIACPLYPFMPYKSRHEVMECYTAKVEA